MSVWKRQSKGQGCGCSCRKPLGVTYVSLLWSQPCLSPNTTTPATTLALAVRLFAMRVFSWSRVLRGGVGELAGSGWLC